MANPEIHQILRIGANGTYATGGVDIGPHRSGGGGGSGDCNCSWSQITGKPTFATVATSGNYNDLSNKPAIPPAYDDTALAARVTALENAGGGGGGSGECNCSWSQITGKPTFSTVATTGNYNDLSNKPSIPAAYDDTALRNRVTANEQAIDSLQGVDLSLGNRITALENASGVEKLSSAITVTNPLGQATNGKVYAVGTSLEQILREVLTLGSTPTPTTYTITFNANGGSVSPTSGTTGTNGKLSSLPTPTHATDTFTGWFTAATGGTQVTTNTVFNENTTIYAQWQAAATEYPWFATTVNTTSAEQFDVDRSLGEYIVNVAAQTEQYPVYIDIPADWNAQAQKWNPFTNQWVRSNDLGSSTVTHNINGVDVSYTRWMDITETDAGATRIRIIWNV